MMFTKTLSALAAVALVGVLTSGASAETFNYSVRTSLRGGAPVAAGTANTTPLAGGGTLTLTGDQKNNNTVETDISLSTLQIVAGTQPITDNVNFQMLLSITDVPSNQTGVFTISGTLTLTGDQKNNNTVETDISLSTLQIVAGTQPITDNVNFQMLLTITDVPSNQSGVFTISGTLALVGLDATGGTQDVTNLTIVPMTQTIGGFPYMLSVFRFSADTVNDPNSTGGFSIRVNAIPEPSTVAMAGLGLIAAAGLGIRRRRMA